MGKDSLATVILALMHHEPLDEIVYCEVMFDKEISGEVPEHRTFIYETAIPWLRRAGLNVKILRANTTYKECFTKTIQRGKGKGKLKGFPLCGRCNIQRDCKVRPIQKYMKSLPQDTQQYVGLATDEQDRLMRLQEKQISLLEQYACSESEAWELCHRYGLLSPVYDLRTATAVGFVPMRSCPNCVIFTTITRICGVKCLLCKPYPIKLRKSSIVSLDSQIMIYYSIMRMLSFVGSHNKEGDNLMKSEIRFKDREHLAFYNMVLKQTRKDDPYHKAFFYVVGISSDTRNNIQKIFDFEEDCIRPDCINDGWQTSGTERITRLAFNLWNGWNTDGYATPYDLFDCEFAPYFMEGIRLRYPEYCRELESQPPKWER